MKLFIITTALKWASFIENIYENFEVIEVRFKAPTTPYRI